jgi:hypothetical protein
MHAANIVHLLCRDHPGAIRRDDVPQLRRPVRQALSLAVKTKLEQCVRLAIKRSGDVLR